MNLQTQGGHVGALGLRRLRAGELDGEERSAVQAHTEGCAHCRARLRGLEDEQRSFEEEISFERFSAGVRRAARPGAVGLPRVRWLYPAMAAAAMVAVVLSAGPLLRLYESPGRTTNRLKGGAGIDLRISTGVDGPQRSAVKEVPEPLGPGERVRIGYEGGGHRYVLSLSVDAEGAVTPLYPEAGESLPIQAEAQGRMEYLPQSLEFTGQGLERVIVILSDRPVEVAAAEAAARRAFLAAGGDVNRMGALDLAPGAAAEQFSRILLKP